MLISIIFISLAVALAVVSIFILIHILQTGISGWNGKSIEELIGKPENSIELDDIKNLSKAELAQLFYAAEPPELEVLNGEYSGSLAHTGAAFFLGKFFTYFIYGRMDIWVGKGFERSHTTWGRGYNLFESKKNKDQIIKKRRIETSIVKSLLDEKNSYLLNYSPYNSGLVHLFRDELRQINDTLFIGVGYLTLPGGSKVNFPFFLAGKL